MLEPELLEPELNPLLPELGVDESVPDVLPEGELPVVPDMLDPVGPEPAPDIPELPPLAPEPPDVSLPAAAPDELPLDGVSGVVVVVVDCPKLAVAVPINDRKMTIGNFFMIAPYVELTDASKLPKVEVRLECTRRFLVFHFCNFRRRSFKLNA